MSPEPMSPQDALVATMIAVAAADEQLTGRELETITGIMDVLPVFRGYDRDRVQQISATVSDLFEEHDGLDALIGLIEQALTDNLRETAYALACDVAASDGKTPMTELKLLEMLRHDLRVGRLAAAAIERGARARFQTVPTP